MKTEWQVEKMSIRRPEFEKVNSTTYIQRRNIEKEEDSEYGDSYICQSRFISQDVYEQIVLVKEVVDEYREPSDDGSYEEGYKDGFTNGSAASESYKDGYEAAMILLGGAE